VITYEEARGVALLNLLPLWGEDDGTLHIEPEGFEDDQAYLVPYGAAEALIGGLFEFERLDAPWLLVDKRTAQPVLVPMLEGLARVEAMRPTGDAAAS
jgi:hypothetical protein